MKLQAQNGPSHFAEIYSILWLSVNGIKAEYKSKLMYQTSLSVSEGWKKLVF